MLLRVWRRAAVSAGRVSLLAAIGFVAAAGVAAAAIEQYTHGCDTNSNWYYLQFYNNGSDDADLNVCVITNGTTANNYYDFVYAGSYSKTFWIGTCEKTYNWYWTDDGSIDRHCR